MAFPIDEAAIVASMIESILYGFSVLLFGLTVRVLLGEDQKLNRGRRLMLVVSVILFTLSTMHMGAVIKLLLNGFIIDRDEFPGGPAGYFEQPNVFPYVFKSAIYAAQTLTGDAILIYRCYVLWQSLWILALPILMWLGVLVTGIGAVTFCAMTTIRAAHDVVFTAELDAWITAFYSCTLATNILSTSILAFKIWDIDRRAAHIRQRSLMHIARIIIDAGALYSISLILSLVAFAIHSTTHLFVDAVTQVIAVSFYMIILRVSKASSRLRLSAAQGSNINTSPPSLWSSNLSGQQYQMNTMGVHISKVVEHKADCLTIDTNGDETEV